MTTTVNIAVAVDVVGALSDKSLQGNIFLMDDSIFKSTGKGTSSLTTFCQPGQRVKWKSYALDLQTPVSIKRITFIGCCPPHCSVTGEAVTDKNGSNSSQTVLDAERENDRKEWCGIVPIFPVPNMDYHYRIEIQMGTGVNSVMAIDTSALRWATVSSPT